MGSIGLIFPAILLCCEAKERFTPGKAMDHLTRLVEMGPHISGSENMRQVQSYIKAHLSEAGLRIEEDRFSAQTPLGTKEMMNIIGIRPGQVQDVIAIGAHYETKYFSDFTFVGANDNCSGTGLLLELARVIPSLQEPSLSFTYWFVFLDGEEAFLKWTESDSLYGSRHLVRKLRENGDIYKIKAFILLDMIGDKDLNIHRDTHSTAWLKNIIWDTSKALGYDHIFLDKEMEVVDDHIPFLGAGISSVDIIDFTYGGNKTPGLYWHTPHDTLDKVSKKSLKIVGEVVLESLPRIEGYLK